MKPNCFWKPKKSNNKTEAKQIGSKTVLIDGVEYVVKVFEGAGYVEEELPVEKDSKAKSKNRRQAFRDWTTRHDEL